MKSKILLLSTILTGLLYFETYSQNNSSINKQNEIVKQLRFKNPNTPIDTLIYKTKKEYIQITPSGLITTSKKFHHQLNIEKDLMVEDACVYENDTHYYIIYTESDLMESVGFLEKINKQNSKSEYRNYIQWSGYPKPLIRNGNLYYASWGNVGKIKLESGKTLWHKNHLYDSKKNAFGGFDSIIYNNNLVKFSSKKPRTEKIDLITVNDETGEVLSINK